VSGITLWEDPPQTPAMRPVGAGPGRSKRLARTAEPGIAATSHPIDDVLRPNRLRARGR